MRSADRGGGTCGFKVNNLMGRQLKGGGGGGQLSKRGGGNQCVCARAFILNGNARGTGCCVCAMKRGQRGGSCGIRGTCREDHGARVQRK